MSLVGPAGHLLCVCLVGHRFVFGFSSVWSRGCPLVLSFLCRGDLSEFHLRWQVDFLAFLRHFRVDTGVTW